MAGGKVGSLGMDSARAVITLVMSEHGLSSLLRHCINLRVDVDTVAAMALGVATGRIFLADFDRQLEAFDLGGGAPAC